MGLSTLTEDAKAGWAGAADACFPATNSKTPTHPRYAGLVEEMGRWEDKLGCLFTVNQVKGKRKYHKDFTYEGKKGREKSGPLLMATCAHDGCGKAVAIDYSIRSRYKIMASITHTHTHTHI